LTPANFLLFPKVKEQLPDITLPQDTFKSSLERAIRTISTEKFAAACRRWIERNKKFM
jgi:hypothetical protein